MPMQVRILSALQPIFKSLPENINTGFIMQSDLFISSLKKQLSFQVGCYQIALRLGCKANKLSDTINEHRKTILKELTKENPDLNKIDLLYSKVQALDKLTIYDN